MEYWKENRYYKNEPMSNAGTWKEELPDAGLLAGIRLQIYMVNGNAIQNSNKSRIIDHLTKLEVTNGADKTMFSLRGQQLKAVDFYDNKMVPGELAVLYGNQTQRTDLYIPFGRFYKDKDYMLDLNAWDSVYLEVTNDLTTVQCADKACKMNVNLVTLEDARRMAAKYIKNYEWRAEKPKADTQYVYHELPTSDIMRRVMVQTDPDIATAGSAVSDPKGDSFNLKFSFKEEKEIVLDARPKDLMRRNAWHYGIVETRGRYFPSATQYWDSAVGYVSNTVGSAFKQGGGDGTDYVHLEDTNDRFQKAGSVLDMTHLDLITKGFGYYHTMVLFDAFNDPESEYLDASKGAEGKGPARIEWYGHTDDHTLRTCLSVPIVQGGF